MSYGQARFIEIAENNLDQAQESIKLLKANIKDIYAEPLNLLTMQDLQLEIIRRTSFNGFKGELIHVGLLKYWDLWRTVILSEQGDGLIRLRDLWDNHWNADTLFINANSIEDAEKLAEIGQEEWNADEAIMGRSTKVSVWLWWD